MIHVQGSQRSDDTDTPPGLVNTYDASDVANINHVLLKGGRIYQHNVLRVNHTSYDVRRGQDTFNPNTDHRDIMMLSESTLDCSKAVVQHHFCYARIIGVYHANVQYIGPGFKDYRPCRLDFIHVRWFEWIPPDPGGVGLDMLHFVPINGSGAFDFIDPAEILRGCHLVPAFAKGMVHPDGSMLSSVARDTNDWKYYYVNR